MKILKLYLISIIINSLPIIGLYLFLGTRIKEIHGDSKLGYYAYGVYFILSSIINLSFFLLKIKLVRNNKVMNFLACYASSLFFLIVAFATYLLTYETIMRDLAMQIGFFMNVFPYFFTNFILATIYHFAFKVNKQ